MVVSLFHGVDNILECILFVLICTQYMLSSSSYVLYVPKSVLSVPKREKKKIAPKGLEKCKRGPK